MDLGLSDMLPNYSRLKVIRLFIPSHKLTKTQKTANQLSGHDGLVSLCQYQSHSVILTCVDRDSYQSRLGLTTL